MRCGRRPKTLTEYSDFTRQRNRRSDTSLIRRHLSSPRPPGVSLVRSRAYTDGVSPHIQTRRLYRADVERTSAGHDPFLIDYEKFLLKYAERLFKSASREHRSRHLNDFSKSNSKLKRFPNIQIFDFEGLRGRMLSSSYMPSRQRHVSGYRRESLDRLFAKHAENGRIKVFYRHQYLFHAVLKYGCKSGKSPGNRD